MTTANQQHRPNPGSDEALDQGCICPVLDNNHGKFPVFPATDEHPASWWISAGCPLHNPFSQDHNAETKEERYSREALEELRKERDVRPKPR